MSRYIIESLVGYFVDFDDCDEAVFELTEYFVYRTQWLSIESRNADFAHRNL
jgi:hypothetical protein